MVSGGEPNHLLAVRALDGDVVFDERVLDESAAAGNCVTGLTVEGGRLYAGSGDGKVIACDLATGEVKWEFRTGGAMLDMAPQRRDAGGSGTARPLRRAGGRLRCRRGFQPDPAKAATTRFASPIGLLEDGIVAECSGGSAP